jgi:hypothetical protein
MTRYIFTTKIGIKSMLTLVKEDATNPQGAEKHSCKLYTVLSANNHSIIKYVSQEIVIQFLE